MEYYVIPRNTQLPYYSTVKQSPDGAKIFISFPIPNDKTDVVGDNSRIIPQVESRV